MPCNGIMLLGDTSTKVIAMHCDYPLFEKNPLGPRHYYLSEKYYLKMKADPYPVDLDALWTDLGVKLDGFRVIYNDDAPMAHVRKHLLKT